MNCSEILFDLQENLTFYFKITIKYYSRIHWTTVQWILTVQVTCYRAYSCTVNKNQVLCDYPSSLLGHFFHWYARGQMSIKEFNCGTYTYYKSKIQTALVGYILRKYKNTN